MQIETVFLLLTKISYKRSKKKRIKDYRQYPWKIIHDKTQIKVTNAYFLKLFLERQNPRFRRNY